jgi:uncharacterized membrane protein YraQ (UPF0718 family)
LVWFALGWQWAVVYTALGLIASILTGLFAHRLGLEPCPWCGPPAQDAFQEGSRFGWSAWKTAFADAVHLLSRLKWALLIGAGLAAALVKFNLTPVQLLTDYGHHPLAPLLAAVIGLPLDVNAAAAGPILIPLAKLGLPVGTLVSLMMATTVASFPEAAVLREMIGWRGVLKLGLWYLAYTAGVGLLINTISSWL